MNEAAAMTIGLHDFGSFATPNPGGTTIREVKTAYWRRVPQRTLIDDGMTMGERYRTPTVESGLVCFVIVADAFARNMVRSSSTAACRSVSANVPSTGLQEKWRLRCAKAPQDRSRRKD